MGEFGFSNATCVGEPPELPCVLHVLKKDSKYQVGVYLGQNSFFLLMPVETTQAQSTARSCRAPGAPSCPQAAAMRTLGEATVPYAWREGRFGWCEGLRLSLMTLSILTHGLHCKPLVAAALA